MILVEIILEYTAIKAEFCVTVRDMLHLGSPLQCFFCFRMLDAWMIRKLVDLAF